MKHLFFCFLIEMLFCGASVPVFERIRATCLDAESKKTIPHATVFIEKANLFTDADSSGVFEIDIAGDDTLLITSIGYKEKKIAVSDVKKNAVVLLQPLAVQLPELFIGKRKKITLGNLKGKKKFDMNSDDCVRYEMATRITVPEGIQRYQLKAITINGIGFNAANPVRIHVYSAGKYGEPHDELMKKDIIIKENKVHNNILTIDVEEQGIILDEDVFFVGVQWIADSINKHRINVKNSRPIGPGIYCSFQNSSEVTYIRAKGGRWGYKWMLYTKGTIYPYDYAKIPAKIESPLNMLLSCDILY